VQPGEHVADDRPADADSLRPEPERPEVDDVAAEEEAKGANAQQESLKHQLKDQTELTEAKLER